MEDECGSGTGSSKADASQPVPVGHLVERALAQVGRQKTDPDSETRDWESGRGPLLLQSTLRRAGVPDTYLSATWEECDVRDELAGFCRGMWARLSEGQGLIVMGPVGTGKSSAAALVAIEAVKKMCTVRWEYVPSLLDELSQWSSSRDALARNRAHDLIIWDDFGVDALTPRSAALLDRVVENRYARRRSMLITTNLSPETLRSDDPLMRRMTSRWRERTKPLVIAGEDRRKR